MFRATFVIAAALTAATAFGSTAQACISCAYTPEVLNSGAGGGSASAKPSQRARDYSEQRERRAKKHVTTGESESKKKTRAAAAPATEKAAVSAASTEHSTMTTNGSSIADHVKAAATPAPAGPQRENSTISTRSGTAAAKPLEQATADKNVGCKKYFPSTGLTLSVPCE